MSRFTRREFVERSIQGTAWAAAAATLPSATRSVSAASANEKVVLALLGAGGRGTHVTVALAGLANVEIKYICDLESGRAATAAKAVEAVQGKLPQVTSEMHAVFDDQDVHGVVVATPEQWHALATILACQAGKDVYVEKCISRRVEEGRKMVQAARKHERMVQAGTQHRSTPYMIAARQYIQDGQLGEILYVKICNMLPETYGGYPLRSVPNSAPPAGFDWDQWLGPAPERPYNPQVHRNWHGYWDFSGGNSSDGIHQLDLARMLVGEPPHPHAISCVGGRWRYQDDGEMPDVQIVTFQWDKLAMSFENTGFSPVTTKLPPKINPEDKLPNWLQSATRIEVYGTKGVMFLGRHFLGWQVLVPGSKLVAEKFDPDQGSHHFQNWVDCIRSRELPNADVEIGHLSACLEHLGNISYRLGNQRLQFDPRTEQFIGHDAANQYLPAAGRNQYRIPDTI
ncbi:MAG: Gfo/Idh/MocA family oxidoreductase [Planctomycetes bacterium]|nr:Gfo/Idh/MocA family oxidoreductase [Planctomycetota bacterium]